MVYQGGNRCYTGNQNTHEPSRTIYCRRCGQEGHMLRGWVNMPDQYKL